MLGTHEELLGPVCQLVAAHGELSTFDAAQILSTRLPILRNLAGDPRSPNSAAFQLVSSAFHSLGIAGLLMQVTPFVWRTTPAGEELSRAKPAQLTFNSLNQYPAYKEHWRTVARENTRQKYLALRFEHYASGRLLLLQGSFNAAPILLAYAIEYHLKAALAEVKEEWSTNERTLVRSKHDLVALYKACLDHALLKTSYVSFDFMRYAGDHFERRYPSGEDGVLAKHGFWSFGGSLLHTYDDCIVQLDAALAEVYHSREYLLGFHAVSGQGVSSQLLDAFFHDNVFAIERRQLYRVEPTPDENLNLDQSLLDRPTELFARDGLPPPSLSYSNSRRLLELDLAAFYRYRRKGEPDPDPIRVLSSWNLSQLPVNYSRWVIERVIAAFGRVAVEVKVDQRGRSVVLTVFDRRAKKWHRSLVLRHANIERFIRNSENELLVDRWIDETRSSFRQLRRNVRVPPKRKIDT